MAYDLARRTVTPHNFAINLPPHTMSLTEKIVLGTVSAATVLGIMQDLQKQLEKKQYQKAFRPGLHKTQQVPVTPMRELMLSPASDQ
jgi:hypothetical protein